MSRRQEDLSTADLAGGGPAETPPDEPRDERGYDEEEVERHTADAEEIREREVLRPVEPSDRTEERDAPDSTTPFTTAPEPAERAEPAEPAQSSGSDGPRLMGADDSQDFNDRWMKVQTRFVDEPREAVREADSLVAELMQRLAEGFAEERAGLEQQWERDDEVSTEDLRVALRRYRTFFNRLLEA